MRFDFIGKHLSFFDKFEMYDGDGCDSNVMWVIDGNPSYEYEPADHSVGISSCAVWLDDNTDLYCLKLGSDDKVVSMEKVKVSNAPLYLESWFNALAVDELQRRIEMAQEPD